MWTWSVYRNENNKKKKAISLTCETPLAFPVILQKNLVSVPFVCVTWHRSIHSFSQFQAWQNKNTWAPVSATAFSSFMVLIIVWFLWSFPSCIISNLQRRTCFYKTLKGHLYNILLYVQKQDYVLETQWTLSCIKVNPTTMQHLTKLFVIFLIYS